MPGKSKQLEKEILKIQTATKHEIATKFNNFVKKVAPHCHFGIVKRHYYCS